MWGDISLCFWIAFSWWLVMLSIFSYACWPSACLLWKNVPSGPLLSFFFFLMGLFLFLISNILEEISSLSHSVVFLYFFALIAEEGFLISPCYSLELCIQMGISFLFFLCFSLLFISQLFVRPPQTAILIFCISFPWGCSWSLSPVQCHEPPSIVHQALYLSDLGP